MEDSTMTATPQVETETTQPQQENQTTEVTQEDKHVPYGRFKEVNEGLKAEREARARLEAEIQQIKGQMPRPIPSAQEQETELVRDKLKQYGFLPSDEVDKIVESKLAQQKADEALDKELSRLEGEYKDLGFTRKDVIEFAIKNGISDPEAAFLKMKKADVINYHIEKAVTKSKGVKSESSDGSGSTQVGTTNSDLMKAAKSGDKQAWFTLLKRI